MNIFLSASVPKVGRGNFSDDANPFLIQLAVRELATTIVRSGKLIWGGHPSITPMIWAVCEYLQVSYEDKVKLYQSRYFEEDFPDENAHFKNVVFVDRIDNSMESSLAKMRHRMLTEEQFDAGVFIGGMEGVLVEYELFKKHQSRARQLVITSPGGAAAQLGKRLNEEEKSGAYNTVDFAELFESQFPTNFEPNPDPEKPAPLRPRRPFSR